LSNRFDNKINNKHFFLFLFKFSASLEKTFAFKKQNKEKKEKRKNNNLSLRQILTQRFRNKAKKIKKIKVLYLILR